MRLIHRNISAECATFAAVRSYFIFNRMILTGTIVVAAAFALGIVFHWGAGNLVAIGVSSGILLYVTLIAFLSGLVQTVAFKYTPVLLGVMIAGASTLIAAFFLPWWLLTIAAVSISGAKSIVLSLVPFAINLPIIPYLCSLILASWRLRARASRKAVSNLYGPFTLFRHPLLYLLKTFDLPPTLQMFRAVTLPILGVFLCSVVVEFILFIPILGFVAESLAYLRVLLRLVPEVILFQVFGLKSFGPWDVSREDIRGIVSKAMDATVSPALLSIMFLVLTPLLILARLLRSLLKRLSVEGLYRRAFADHRPPILFLRTFADDRVRVRAYPIARILRLFHKEAAFSTIDELLVSEFWHVAPIVALGNPADRFRPFGAAREYVAHSAWNDKINDLMVSARNVLVCYEETPSISWEVNRLKTIGALSKTLFLLTSRKAPSTETLSSLSEKLGVSPESVGSGLSPLQPVAVVPVEDDCVVVFWSTDRSEAEYQVVLRRWLGGNLLKA